MFGFGKKKEKENSCAGSSALGSANTQETSSVSVKVLGMGCGRCNELTRNVQSALKELGIELEVEHVTELAKIAAYGVMSTPALVFGDKVVSAGKVLSAQEVIDLIKSKQLAEAPQNKTSQTPCG